MSKKKLSFIELPMLFDRSCYRKQIPAGYRKVVNKGVNKAVKEIAEHMSKDKWDLSAKDYAADILYKIYGFHIEEYLLWEIWNKISKTNPRVKLLYGQEAPGTVFTVNGKKHSEVFHKVWKYYLKITGKDKLIRGKRGKTKTKTSRSIRRRN
jgi:hypothetical protein